MLISLHVKNMALIREEEIFFGEGLNILTGETGAGKSILIGSVNVALGTDSFKDYVSDRSQDALSELTFETAQTDVLDMLAHAGIDVTDGQVVITRKFHAGRSINRVNGESVSAGFIRELAAHLIDIHGQHEHQSLLYPRFHLTLLDRYCREKLTGPLERCRQIYDAYKKSSEELEKAVMDENERLKKTDILTFEINEIESASPFPGEDEQLEKDYLRMANAQKILQGLSLAQELTSSSDGAGDMISRAVRELVLLSDCDETAASLSDELSQIEDMLNGFGRDLGTYLSDFTYDEQDFNRIQLRLDTLNHLKARYGRTIDEVLAYLGERQAELERLNDYENWLNDLKKKVRERREELLAVCKEIHQIRAAGAKELEVKITQALTDLNFSRVQFRISFEETKEPGPGGADRVCFMLSVNPGMPLRPLQETASGGELSRIMLAIKAVMAGEDQVETLIFDEIDSGISGRTAQKVSEKMAVIARFHQVLCITHLAQIASMADVHFAITKDAPDGVARTNISRLDREGSVEELTRILGGAQITDSVRESAREMKQMAEEWKNGPGNE